MAEALNIDTVDEVFDREATMSKSIHGQYNLEGPSPVDFSSTLLRHRFRTHEWVLEQQHKLGILSGQVQDL